MRFHVVALPHTDVSSEFLADAYQQKCKKFAQMMKSLGHEVFLYSSENTDAEVDEHISIISKEEQESFSGPYDHKKEFFKIDWNPGAPIWQLTNHRVIEALSSRLQKTDFICLIGGVCQEPIANAYPAHMSVEFGIGYRGVFSKYRVFESYSWMHYIYGTRGINDGHFYDSVIPNYFDPADFPQDEPEDYHLYIGRMVARKGVNIAVEVTKELGVPLYLAGQGARQKGNKVVFDEGSVEGDHITYLGTLGLEERAKVMSRAKAVWVPTTYIEPFGGVSVEAMMSGTPVITTDFGAFTETVIHGVSGYRFRTFGEAVWAGKNIDQLDRDSIRRYAIANFSMDRIKYLYQAYFEQLLELWDKGWYSSLDSGNSIYSRYQKELPACPLPDIST